MLTIVPCSLKRARVFVGTYHRHHRAPTGGLVDVLIAVENAGIDREDVLRLYTSDGCYDFADALEAAEAGFRSWSILDRERPAMWRHAPGRAARERPTTAAMPLPRVRAEHGQMDLFQGAAHA